MANPASEDGVILWQDEAKCFGLDVEKFFERATESEAKRFCKLCPVRNDCLEYALLYDMYGIWGGMSYKERQRKYPVSYRQMLREDAEESGTYIRELKA